MHGVGCFLRDKYFVTSLKNLYLVQKKNWVRQKTFYHSDFIKGYILKANLKSFRKFMPRVINYLKKKDGQVSSKLKLVKLIHYLR